MSSYDEWKLDSGYDYPTPLAEAQAEIHALADQNDKLINALDECLDWFEERQDVVDGPDGQQRPNDEMEMAWKLKEVLK